MTISIWVAVAIAIITLFIGFWIGQSMRWMAEETEERISQDVKMDIRRLPTEWVVSSPVSGEICSLCENGKCSISIRPDEECLYAPVAGRISKLYPMGNAMLISTDFGVEVMVNIGREVDELCSMYFRPRVVQSEIISKGRPLLEFDRPGLEKEGVDVAVSISVEQLRSGKTVAMTQSERVKAGDALVWV